MKKKSWLSVFAMVASICLSAGAVNITNTAGAEETTDTGVETQSLFDEKNIVLTAATITDPHIGYSGNDNKLKNTLSVLTNWAGETGIDMFISAGDNTQNGIKDEADYFMDILSAHYDLTKIPLVVAHGNHDVYWTDCIQRAGFYDAYNAKGMYAFDKDLESAKLGNRHVEINGYHFLTVDIEKYGDNYNTLSDATEAWLQDKLATLSVENEGEPIFVISHSPAMNTVYGSILADAEYGNIATDDTTAIWGASVELDNILKDYPQVINISGHTHYAVNHDLAIMQTTYTSFTPGGAADLAANKDTEETVKGSMPDARTHSQGTLLQIDANNNVRITRIDIVKNQEIREAWIIPAPQADNSHLEPYSYRRAETNTAPVFPADEAFNVTVEGTSIVKITYPIATDDDMVYSYRLSLKDDKGTVLASATTLAPWIEYPNLSDIPETLNYTFSGVNIEKSCVVEIAAIDCWGKETIVEKVVEQSYFDLLESGASFDNTDAKLTYNTATKTGVANAPSSVCERYFSYETNEYVNTADGVTSFAGLSAEYSVTYTDISMLNTIADSSYVGMLFSVDGYALKYRVGSKLNYGGSDYLPLGSDANSPFAVSATGNKRNLKGVVVTEENPTATIVVKFTPKVGDTNGSYTITVNGVSAGTYEYSSTSLPKMGLYIGKNTANIANASIKVFGATGWFEAYDLLADESLNNTLKSDGQTTADDYSYDFANKVGYIGGDANGAGVALGERATAYFNIDMPDKFVTINGDIIDYSNVEKATISMTFSDVVAGDGTFDATNNNEFVAIRIVDPVSKQIAGFWCAPGAIFGHYGVIERSKADSTSVFAPETSGNIRYGGSTSPWIDGSVTISLEITPAKAGVAGSIGIYLNGDLKTTISYTSEVIPEFGMYSRGTCAKVSNVSCVLKGVRAAHVHTEETLESVAPTCTTDGLTEGKKCSVCDMILVEQQTILAAHTTIKTEAVEATCTEAGNIAYWTCSGECKGVYADEACTIAVTDTVVAAKGHDTMKTDAVEATCETDGNIDFWFCNVCSKIYADAEYTIEITAEEALISAMGHTESEWIIDAEAQIGVAGSKHTECVNCGETMATEEIPALEAPEESSEEESSEEVSSEEESSEIENSEESSKDDTTSIGDSKNDKEKSGCFGSVSGLPILAFMGVALLALRKKED